MTFKLSKSRLAGKLLCAVASASFALSYACTRVEPQQVAQQIAPAPVFTPAVSINELMVAWVDHSGHELWDREIEGRAPKTDAEWREVDRHAAQLAAAGTLIALGGTGKADPGWAMLPDWKKYSQELTKTGLAAQAAVRSRSFDSLVKVNGQLVEVCENCHNEFKPELPTEGKTHQPH